jgi:hypothetical protein
MPLPTVSEMQARHAAAMRVRHLEVPKDASEAIRAVAAVDAHEAGVRLDVANVPKVADLYAASLERSKNRWRNTGDAPERADR